MHVEMRDCSSVYAAGQQMSSTGAGAVSSGSVFSGGIGRSESLRFWEQNNNMRSSKLVMIAQDLISAPASQSFVERMFSLCGIYLQLHAAAVGLCKNR